MNIKYGKEIDSFRLKKGLNKEDSIKQAQKMSLSVSPGHRIDKCPICGEPSRDKAEIYTFCYAECMGCGVLFVVNVPDDKFLSGIYRSENYTALNKTLLANDNILDYRINTVMRPKFDFISNCLTTKKRTWLDVGCGVGEMVKIASDAGWDALGLETNEMEREWGKNRLKVRIEDSCVDESTFDNLDAYGVISLMNLLEHFKDPESIIRSISRIQEEGDNLAIEVPHYPSITAFSQIAFPECVNRAMHPPLHLFLFTLKSLVVLLEKSGYEITDAWYFGQDFYEVISTLGLFAKGLDRSILYEHFSSMMNEFQEVIDRKELSDQVLVVSKKK